MEEELIEQVHLFQFEENWEIDIFWRGASGAESLQKNVKGLTIDSSNISVWGKLRSTDILKRRWWRQMAAQELLLSEVTAEGPTSCCAMQSSTTNIFIWNIKISFFQQFGRPCFWNYSCPTILIILFISSILFWL